MHIVTSDPLLELSQQDGSNGGSQNVILLWKNMANYSLNYPVYPFLSGALLYS